MRPATQPAMRPGNQPVTWPANQPVIQLANRQAMGPATQPAMRPATQPVTRRGTHPPTRQATRPSTQTATQRRHWSLILTPMLIPIVTLTPNQEEEEDVTFSTSEADGTSRTQRSFDGISPGNFSTRWKAPFHSRSSRECPY